ncbi:MAG: branched-chain-amino-acid transaminase [Opitutales bacterium]|jgi:branched-chain amino acid aminotransferase|nr:branched-chain-amino-acid transaminase [Opitutales bacterium]
MEVYIDGKFYPKAEAKISVFDHGFLYGDGIFEGIRLYKGCVFRLEEHLERLEMSAKALCLNMPWTRKEISDIVCESCRRNKLTDGYIRLVVSRGFGDLGLSPKNCPTPSIICIADSIKLYPEELYTTGMKIITAPTRRVSPAALPPMIKSLNYLNNILAKMEAQQHGFHECLMLNEQGYVSECTGDNVFLIHKGKLITPASYAGALVGITRQVAIEVAQALDIPVVETNITRYDVWNADECFLTGTAAEVIPVIEVDARTIGTGKPGPLTAKILTEFRKKASKEGTMIN